MDIQIIEVPPNSKVNRFGPTFSIWERGDFWRSTTGSRRAWSTLQAAEIAIANSRCPLLNEKEKRMKEMKARDALLSAAIAYGRMGVSRGIRNIPRKWKLSDLKKKSDRELLSIDGLGDTTLQFIKQLNNGELQEEHWMDIEGRIEEYSKMYPNVLLCIHHEVVPPGCVTPTIKLVRGRNETRIQKR